MKLVLTSALSALALLLAPRSAVAEVCVGAVYTTTAAADAALASCTSVTGTLALTLDANEPNLAVTSITTVEDLLIDGPGVTDHALNTALPLVSVTGILDITSTATGLVAPALSSLDLAGTIRIEDHATMTSFAAPLLTTLTSAHAGALLIENCALLETIDMPLLTAASSGSGDVVFKTLPALTSLAVGTAAAGQPFVAGRHLTLEGLDLLESLGGSFVDATIGGTTRITDCNSLTDLTMTAVSLPVFSLSSSNALTTMAGFDADESIVSLSVQNMPALVDISALANAMIPTAGSTRTVTISSNDALTAISLTSLVNLRYIWVQNNAALVSVSAPLLETVRDAGAKFTNNPLLESVSLPRLQTIPVGNSHLLFTGLPALVSIDVGSEETFTSSSGVTISDCDLLTSLGNSFKDATMSYLTITGSDLFSDLSMDAVSIGTLSLSSLNALTTLAGFTIPDDAINSVSISSNDNLVDVSALQNKLAASGPTARVVTIKNNPLLTSLSGMLNLVTHVRYMHIVNLPIDSFSAPALTLAREGAGHAILIQGCDLLTSIDIPLLNSIPHNQGPITFTDLPQLATVNVASASALTSLASVAITSSGDFTIGDSFKDADLAGSLTISASDIVDFSMASIAAGELSVVSNPLLESLTISGLTDQVSVNVAGNVMLGRMQLGAVANAVAGLLVSDNPVLRYSTFPGLTAETATIPSLTIAMNPEQCCAEFAVALPGFTPDGDDCDAVNPCICPMGSVGPTCPACECAYCTDDEQRVGSTSDCGNPFVADTELTVAEGDSEGTFTLSLAGKPSDSVTVTFTATEGAELLSVFDPLTFRPAEFTILQDINFSIVDDDSWNDVGLVTIEGVTTSSDSRWEGIEPLGFTVSIEENDTPPQCGNSVTEFGEECDDGNVDDTDGCTTQCYAATCGNGILESGEGCDDNEAASPGCSAACTVEDGYVCSGSPLSVCVPWCNINYTIEQAVSFGDVLLTSGVLLKPSDLANVACEPGHLAYNEATSTLALCTPGGWIDLSSEAV